ncbi:MAG: hypothetical protein ACRYF2_04080 [Janthinobacterium lividum]
MSRPTTYVAETAEAILQRIAGGESLRSICAAPDMPAESTVRTWGASQIGFGEQLRQAREASASHWDEQAERVLVEAVGTREELARAKELAQHYRWRASKYAPRDYGERVDLNVTGAIAIGAQLAEVRARRALIDGEAEPVHALPAPGEAGEQAA